MSDDRNPTRDPVGSPANHPARPRRGADAVSLVVGVVFVGIAGGWALTWTGLMTYGGLGWYLPLLLVIAGLLGVLASRRRS